MTAFIILLLFYIFKRVRLAVYIERSTGTGSDFDWNGVFSCRSKKRVSDWRTHEWMWREENKRKKSRLKNVLGSKGKITNDYLEIILYKIRTFCWGISVVILANFDKLIVQTWNAGGWWTRSLVTDPHQFALSRIHHEWYVQMHQHWNNMKNTISFKYI